MKKILNDYGPLVAIITTVALGVWTVNSNINKSFTNVNDKVNTIYGEIKSIHATMDGMEIRLSNVEREVHSINEHLRGRLPVNNTRYVAEVNNQQ